MHGQTEAAARAYERGLASGAQRGANLLGLAFARFLLGHRDDGLRALAQGLEITRDPIVPWGKIVNRYGVVIAGAYLAAGLPEEALLDWGRRIDLATELSMRPELAHCHVGLGNLYRRTGDGAKAREHLTSAATLYRKMDMGFWLEKAEAALGAAP